ncbi:MAG TPA: 4-hydroxybenzoate octaprenyltransferase, partial [Stenotrophomonas sp.]|nr:4-hydroxybenzoate octaprenyltransferase [Stenotrophomonas sp.]
MADTPLISPQSSATPRWRHYWSLMRADRPIGTLLLLWPTWWALWLAAGGLP